jgi:hypothetical protein
MEIIFTIIGVIASVFGIWDFLSVRLKKLSISKRRFVFSSLQKLLGNTNENVIVDGYRIPNEQDLAKGDWKWAYDKVKLPYITLGNFFGDGKLAEALILIREDEAGAKIIVRRYGESKYIELITSESVPFSLYVDTVPAGEHSSYWEKIDLKLETHGIEISFLEASSFIMYWDAVSGEFKTYHTAD